VIFCLFDRNFIVAMLEIIPPHSGIDASAIRFNFNLTRLQSHTLKIIILSRQTQNQFFVLIRPSPPQFNQEMMRRAQIRRPGDAAESKRNHVLHSCRFHSSRIEAMTSAVEFLTATCEPRWNITASSCFRWKIQAEVDPGTLHRIATKDRTGDTEGESESGG
jgi:hypothetical protein